MTATIFTPSSEIVFEKTLKDGRIVTVHPAYEGAKVFRVQLGGKFTADSYQKLASVKGGGFCLPFGKAAVGMTNEEVVRFNQGWSAYLSKLDARHKNTIAIRRKAYDHAHPRLNWAVDTYGTHENARSREDVFAADLLLQLESGAFEQKINDFYKAQ